MSFPIRVETTLGFAAVGLRLTVGTADELGPAVAEARRDLQEARRFYCDTLGFTVIAQFGRSVHGGPTGSAP